jgi:hypothetical protein
MIARGTVLCLGCSQLLCWGISYYLIGALGQPMADGLSWSASVVHGGFSLALLVMGLSSPSVGRAVDRHSGRPVMAVGSGLIALGCLGLAATQGIVTHYLAWACLGLAMRMTLYDAAFAALARIGGPLARVARSPRSRSWAGLPRPSSGRSDTFWKSSSAGEAPSSPTRQSQHSRFRSTWRSHAAAIHKPSLLPARPTTHPSALVAISCWPPFCTDWS